MIIAINLTEYEIYTFSGLQKVSSITNLIADDLAIRRASAKVQCSF